MKQLLIFAGLAVLAAAAQADARPKGYGTAGCPPGLAKKNNGCLPPGQAKKLYGVGYRFDRGFNGWTPYNQIPYDIRNQYGLNPSGRYIYDQNYIYQVDPTTYAVSRVLDAILR